MTAAPSIAEILARVPQLEEHSVAPPALTPLPDSTTIERDIRAAIAATPEDARAYAALGNLLARRALYLAARNAYIQAVARDDRFAPAHLAIAELSALLRDAEATAEHLHAALALRRRYDDPLPVDRRPAVLLLLRDESYAVNAPIEVILDRHRIAVHKVYVGALPREPLPSYDVALCAFGPVYDIDTVGEHALALVDGTRLLNRPARIAKCRRERLTRTLSGIANVAVVETSLVSPEALESISLPALVRPAGTQAGTGFAQLYDTADIHAHAARFPAPSYHVSRFIDYRSADGYYRKYRIVLVNGIAYPYHLAVSPRWMVHYQSSPMEEHEWMREEEASFLADPASVFPQWNETVRSIGEALGLDYVGLDVTRLADGTMLVFEADPAMLLHDEDEGGVFAYKRPYVAVIREALHALLSGYARTP